MLIYHLYTITLTVMFKDLDTSLQSQSGSTLKSNDDD